MIQVDGQFYWTRAKIPEEIWAQFLPREDEQIGGQELMAVPLLLGTFSEFLKGSLLLLAIDTAGVVGSMIAGRGTACDHNAAIAKVWLNLASMGVAPHLVRVETSCNVADGPTRENLEFLQRLKATWCEPRWPDWASDFWEMKLQLE